jgi:uncharacterized protein (DUF1778 family)
MVHHGPQLCRGPPAARADTHKGSKLSETVNLTLTEQQLREIDRHARAQGMTRSAFLVKAGLQS